jgi:hypothetical protein
MKNKRFKTNKTLSVLIAIPVFLVCWLYSGIVSKGGGVIGLAWIGTFQGRDMYFGDWAFLGVFTLGFAAFALSVGYVLQALIVIFRNRNKKERHDVA